jgi:hypothetical protein
VWASCPPWWPENRVDNSADHMTGWARSFNRWVLGFAFFFFSLFLVLAVLGFQLRALHLVGRHSVTSATPPTPFVFRLFFR